PARYLRICNGQHQLRIADALARWTAVVEGEASTFESPAVQDVAARNLQACNGELMPISRSWGDAEASDLTGQYRAIARLALVLAKAPCQVTKTSSKTSSTTIGARNISFAFSLGRRFPARVGSPSASPKRHTVSPAIRTMPRK